MLIESHVVGLSEVKRYITSFKQGNCVVVGENIFMLKEKPNRFPQHSLSTSTPDNHPEALIVINKKYTKDLLLDSDAFAFRKSTNDVPHLEGVTLHLSFSGSDLIDDLMVL